MNHKTIDDSKSRRESLINKLNGQMRENKADNINQTSSDPNDLMKIIKEYESIVSNKDNNL